MERYLKSHIIKDLQRGMVFIGGPRQVGKTTLALDFLPMDPKTEENSYYFTWDSSLDQKRLLDEELPSGKGVIILDEVHKFQQWRNLVKGLYDKNKYRKQFIVTGSAKLDYYSRGGDSLQGRYHYYRLHPLTLDEIGASNLNRLLEYGGFPQPYLEQDKIQWARWQKERKRRVVYEDLQSLENVKDLSKIDLLVTLLMHRVGSLLSINGLREDLQSSFDAIDRWIQILENLYYCYRIGPFALNEFKGLKKEKKCYLWDWSLITDPEQKGAKWENFVAGHLLKYCHWREDVFGENINLHYLRDMEKREIDFLVTKDNIPQFAVECKYGAQKISPHIEYFSKRLDIPYFYQIFKDFDDPSKNIATEMENGRIQKMPFSQFWNNLVAREPD